MDLWNPSKDGNSVNNVILISFELIFTIRCWTKPKMMTPTLLQRVVRSMETIAPLSLTETAWDNTGLLLEAPFPRQSASQILLTIDLTQRVLDEAINNKHVGVIIAYHPPLFKSFKRLVMGDDRQRIALRCAAAGISVYSPHSALDNCIGGIIRLT